MQRKGKDHPDFIVRPEWFTKEWFTEMKKKGVKNTEICEQHLFVSNYILQRFLREVGVEPGHMALGRPRKLPGFVTYEYIDKLRKKGWTFVKIATMIGAPITTVRDVYYPRGGKK